MKICAVFSHYHPVFAGGAINFSQLAREFVGGGHEVWVLTFGSPGLPAEEFVDGVRVVRVSRFGSGMVNLISFWSESVFELIRRRKEFDLLHTHSLGASNAPLVFAAKMLGKKVVYQVTLMGMYPCSIPDGVASHFLRIVSSFVDGFVANSTPILKKIKENSFIEKPCVVLPRGVDTAKYHPVSEEEKTVLRRQLGLKQRASYVIFVGIITERKGVDVLVDAFGVVAESNPEAQLLLVGPYSPQDEVFSRMRSEHADGFVEGLKAKIEESGLEDRVSFTGYTDRVAEYMQASDVFVFPSRREGLPASVLQAMATGLPCVVSELDGVSRDIIEEDVDGFVIDEPKPEEYAERITHLLSDDEGRSRIGLNARRSIEKRFRLEDVAGRYLEYYAVLLGDAGG